MTFDPAVITVSRFRSGGGQHSTNQKTEEKESREEKRHDAGKLNENSMRSREINVFGRQGVSVEGKEEKEE